MNIYYAYRARSANGVVSVWIDRRLFSNLAGIDKDLFDAWDVDCRERRMRSEPALRVGATSSATPESSWSTPLSGTPLERLLSSVCTDIDSGDAPRR